MYVLTMGFSWQLSWCCTSNSGIQWDQKRTFHLIGLRGRNRCDLAIAPKCMWGLSLQGAIALMSMCPLELQKRRGCNRAWQQYCM